MSELKEHLFCECDECIREYRGPLSNEMRPYYLKSESDEVIEKLEEKHLRDLQDAEDSFKSVLELNRKELRHHKYKRCLDMARWCKLWYETEKYEWHLKDVHHWFRMSLYDKWHKRWLELAEKFKETK